MLELIDYVLSRLTAKYALMRYAGIEGFTLFFVECEIIACKSLYKALGGE